MQTQTARLVFATLALAGVAALAWFLLRDDAPQPTRPEANPAREPTAPVDERLKAEAGLQAAKKHAGSLLIRIDSEDPALLVEGRVLVFLEGTKQHASVLLRGTADGPKVDMAQLPYEQRATVRGLAGGAWELEIRGVSQGTHRLRAQVNGTVASEMHVAPQEVIVDGEGGTATLAFTSAPVGASLRVRVVQAGRDIPDAHIGVFDGEREAHAFRTRAPDPEAEPGAPDGGWVGVPADADLRVEVADYRGRPVFGALDPQQIRLALGEVRTLIFEVPAGQQIQLRARSSRGEMVPYSLVLWQRGGSELVSVPVMQVFVAKSGTWMGRLPAGRYRAAAMPNAHYGRGTIDFNVSDPTPKLQIVDIPVTDDGARVVLTLTADDERRVAEVSFNLNRITAELSAADFVLAKTDATGRVTTRPMKPGGYRLYLWDAGWMHEVDVKAPETPLTLHLPPRRDPSAGSSIGGVLTLPDGSPARGLFVHAASPAGGWVAIAPVGPKGRFKIVGLAPGAYEVSVPVGLLDEQSYQAVRRSVALGKANTDLRIRLKAE